MVLSMVLTLCSASERGQRPWGKCCAAQIQSLAPAIYSTNRGNQDGTAGIQLPPWYPTQEAV